MRREAPATGDRRAIRVLHSIAPPEPGRTRFVDHLVEGAPADVEVMTFSWRAALTGRYDVFHVHWPERLVRKAPAKTLALLALLRVKGVPIVRTLHNVAPHERGWRGEQFILSAIDRRTELFVRLNPYTPVPTTAPAIEIPHPHYLPRLTRPRRIPVRGRVLYFGIVRPYKGVDELVRAFEAVDDPELRLRIVGSATGSRGQAVMEASARDARIEPNLRYIPDLELEEEISAAELVVLPYRNMHNSGAMLLALSIGRPVLVPRNEVNEAIAGEVGRQWVHLFDGIIDDHDIVDALDSVRASTPHSPPNLRSRDWESIGQALQFAYSSLLEERSRAR